jgi:hypothetical protein
MKPLSLGRFNFNLPDEFDLVGRNQSIYHVEIMTIPLKDKSPADLWYKRIEKIKSEIISSKMLWEKEIHPDFPAVFYQTDPTVPSVNMEAQKTLKDHILILKYQGKKNMETDMMRLISIIAGGYQQGITKGFNIGAGSITSKPSVNEHAFIKFKHQALQTEVSINTQTAGRVLNVHPLDDVSNEIKGLALEGIKLKVLIDEKKTVAGLPGFEGHVILDSPEEEPIFRNTWFFQGEQKNSFKPEILIKMTGPEKHIEAVNEIWIKLLKSIRLRSEN